ncbi:MAG TPA: ATPase domain-containing protein [Minicystis sp.]|nr:ATPase domain-containing protein [Minicystis sp.]
MNDAQPEQGAPERFPSGVRGLDVVLGGGFLVSGTYILMGPPGAGKTILGNQICFHHVANGGRAVYVTLLAESHSRMLSHIRSLKFFDPAPISAALTYVSGYRVLEDQGLAGLLDLVRKLIRDHRATLVVLDGLVSAEAFAPSELVFKKFIHELNTLVGIVGCTTFLLTNGSARTDCPEHTMVDGLVELSDLYPDARAVRELVVRKLRGADHLRGRHAFEITDEGVVVHPRLEAVVARAAAPRGDDRIVPFGVDGLDQVLGGGVRGGTTTMLLGPSGSGKTSLGTAFLVHGAELGEPGVYFGFHEAPTRLTADAAHVGVALDEHAASGRIRIVRVQPGELLSDAVAEHLLDCVRATGARRLFLDGLAGFTSALVFPSRLMRFFSALATALRALDVTTVFSQETRVLFGPGIEVPHDGLSASADNAIFVRQVEDAAGLRRILVVLKSRGAPVDGRIRELELGPRGVRLGAPFDARAEGLLLGVVHHRPGDAPRPARSRAAARAKPKGRRPARRK